MAPIILEIMNVNALNDMRGKVVEDLKKWLHLGTEERVAKEIRNGSLK